MTILPPKIIVLMPIAERKALLATQLAEINRLRPQPRVVPAEARRAI